MFFSGEEYKFSRKQKMIRKIFMFTQGSGVAFLKMVKLSAFRMGAQWTNPLSSGFSRLMGKAIGSSYQDFG